MGNTTFLQMHVKLPVTAKQTDLKHGCSQDSTADCLCMIDDHNIWGYTPKIPPGGRHKTQLFPEH